ncbi:GGDEF domain-containing protein [Paraglaciecola sp. L3A3]|uniref:GGDEF domain-containing protein n=1 Tax=Paraglaciecola sp. L3A3 TaxID=2686358 RepID=UPI00131A6E5D|nr:GGDEF domain-containing protein [Paraglaciecola sp. L3A3]
MNNGFATLASRIGDFLNVTQDGYAIFCMQDKLIGCNQAFADIMYLDINHIVGKTFDELYRVIYEKQQGPKINSNDIDAWLKDASLKRRSRDFRLFEVDLVDGRWFLISEQTLANGDLLLQAKNITKQKMIEHSLFEHSTQLSNLAATDELTQIANRRCFISHVQAELKRCERSNLSAVFCLLDIDFFKRINDKFGHIIGDRVLVKLAQVVKRFLREYDPFGRIGGEEFAIFLPETNMLQAKDIMQRLCDLIVETNFNSSQQSINLTVSIGLVENWNGATFEQLYSNADVALFEAKGAGRNRIAVFEQI